MIDLKENKLLREIPNNLLIDKRVVHLAEALQPQLTNMLAWVSKINFTENLEELDEEILEHLLWEKHIGWSDGLSLAMTKEEKINLIKASIEIHRYKGTPFAIEKVLEALNISGKVIEWFEYGGNPFFFKIDVEITSRGVSEETIALLERLVDSYKNKRSWVDAINLYLTSKPSQYIASSMYYGEEITVYPWTNTLVESKGSLQIATKVQSVETLTIYPQ